MNNIIGHKAVINQLKQMFLSKHLASAYIFYGQKGIGKYKTAIYFAKLINCLHPTSDNDPCHSCSSCVKIDNQVHPDCHTIQPDGSQIKIETVRTALQLVVHEPLIANYRVIIIDEADKLNQTAANALLKPLEEPLTKTIYLMVVQNLHQMLSTILSRSQKIAFLPLQKNDLYSFLQSTNSTANLTEAQIQPLVSMCNGSIGQLQALMDDQVIQRLDNLWQVMSDLSFKKFSQEFFSELDQFCKQENLVFVLNQLTILFRDVIIFSQTQRSERCILLQQLTLIENLANNYTLTIIFNCMDLIYDYQYQLSLHPSHLQFWEALMGTLGDTYELCTNS